MENEFSNLRFGLYVRKSNEDAGKQILSIESQTEEMEQFAKDQGFNVVRIFKDEGSAHKPNNRDGYMVMMDMLCNGEIDAVLTWKADRLARNMVEGGQIIHSLQSGVLKCIQTRYSRFTPNDSMLSLTVELGMANQFSLDLSKNIKRGNKTKIGKGGWCGVAPHGFLNDRIDKTVIHDPERFHLVRRMWDLYLTGTYSLSQICKISDEDWGFRTIKRKKQGGTKLHISSLHSILTNPFYYGRVGKGKNENWGTHKPMVSQKEFEKVQEILGREGRAKTESREFPFTGLIKCGECDSAITAEQKVKYACPKCRLQLTARNPHECKRCGHKITKRTISKGNWYVYYRCTKKKGPCSQGYVRDEILEDQIIETLSRIEIDPDFEEWAIKWLKYLHQENSQVNELQLKSLQKNYNKAQKRLDELFDMRLDREIEKEKFESKKKELEGEREQWQQQLHLLQQNSDKYLTEAEQEFDFVSGVCERFKKGSIKEKKFIFSKTSSNLVLNRKEITLGVQKQYLEIQALRKLAPKRLELPKTLCDKGLMGDVKRGHLAWYTR